MKKHFIIFLLILTASEFLHAAKSNVIEKQLEDIGRISDEDVMVVQRKYTRKGGRHEFTPFSLGGIPFGTVRRTLTGGANYTLHLSDWLGIEAFNFLYSKTFFSSFTDDINGNKERTTQADIKPDYQKLLYFLTGGFQLTPFYGKISTLSRWILYIEPFVSVGGGLAKTETDSYLAYYAGVGIRGFFREWFSTRLEFRDYMYSEKFVSRTAAAGDETARRDNFAVNLSLSFWLPKMP